MAAYYVYSGAAGAADGSSWTDAYTTLSAALAARSAGDTFYVADDHANSSGSNISLTSPGTPAAPCQIICVRRSGGSVPPVSADLRTTATISTTGSATITFAAGCAYVYGITFNSGATSGTSSLSITTTASSTNWYFDCCSLQLGGSNANNRINFGSSSTSSVDRQVILNNTTVRFANASQGIMCRSPVTWRSTNNTNVIAAGGTTPTTLFIATGAFASNITLQGLDLSTIGSGNIFDVSGAAAHIFKLEGCRIHASTAITTGTNPGPGGPQVWLLDCDSTNTNYRYAYYGYQGSWTQETTIVRSAGASDGTTSFSRKMIGTANALFVAPLQLAEMVVWNNSTGSQLTAMVRVVSDNVTFKNDELWMEVEYLGSASYPITSIATNAKADILAAGANQTSSSSTWTTTGLSTPVYQRLDVSFTPQMKGPVICRVYLAKNATVYVDPQVDGVGTKGRNYQWDQHLVQEAVAGSGISRSRAVNAGGV